MPCKSPEAIERKKRKKREKYQAAKAKVVILKSDLPCNKITARRMRPRLPDMSKAELRDMLAVAMANTAK